MFFHDGKNTWCFIRTKKVSYCENPWVVSTKIWLIEKQSLCRDIYIYQLTKSLMPNRKLSQFWRFLSHFCEKMTLYGFVMTLLNILSCWNFAETFLSARGTILKLNWPSWRLLWGILGWKMVNFGQKLLIFSPKCPTKVSEQVSYASE